MEKKLSFSSKTHRNQIANKNTKERGIVLKQ